MPTTYKGLTVPIPTDLADGPTAFAAYTDSLPFQVFATVAARDAWTTAPNGAMCVTIDTYTLWVRRGGVWSSLTPVSNTLTLSAGTVGSTAVALGSISLGTVAYARVVRVSAMIFVNGSTTGRFELSITMGAATLSARGEGDGWHSIVIPPVELSLAANTAGTVSATARLISGSDNGFVTGGSTTCRLDVLSRGV